MKKFIINENPWETRIAITRDGLLQNIYFDSHTSDRLERSYYKGTVTKILPGIQTAFVDIGQEKSGFLHISEIDRELALKKLSSSDDEIEEAERPRHAPSKREMDITKILREGEQILVQVSKEPIYEKGAKLTTCFTLPGRFIVLMPNIPRIGISKKIDDPSERNRLHTLLRNTLPEGMGAIIRTTSEDHRDQEIIQDVTYLVNTWREIQNKFQSARGGEKVYEDIDLTLQIIRDNVDDDVDLIVCDSKSMESRIYAFLKDIAPEHLPKIRYYSESQPLFEKYEIEGQIDQALHRKVQLKSGGSIIIETTEAMTVVDVNTSRFIGSKSLEETILKTNLEAADEVVRQLRLRNIGGLIVIDFIDMAQNANRQKLFKYFEKALKERDKFQSVVLKVSEFGLVQMTRKRSGKTLLQQLTETCLCCNGTGFIKSVQGEAYAILRKVAQDLAAGRAGKSCTLLLHQRVFDYLINVEYNAILKLEKEYRCKIALEASDTERLNVYSLIA